MPQRDFIHVRLQETNLRIRREERACFRDGRRTGIDADHDTPFTNDVRECRECAERAASEVEHGCPGTDPRAAAGLEHAIRFLRGQLDQTAMFIVGRSERIVRQHGIGHGAAL